MFGESQTSQFQYTLEILQNIKSLKTFSHKKSWLGENFRSWGNLKSLFWHPITATVIIFILRPLKSDSVV